MRFVFQVKGCSLGIKSMHTVNVYTSVLYIHSFMVPGDGNFGGGELTVIFRVTKIGKNTTQKMHTHKKNHTIHYD